MKIILILILILIIISLIILMYKYMFYTEKYENSITDSQASGGLNNL